MRGPALVTANNRPPIRLPAQHPRIIRARAHPCTRRAAPVGAVGQHMRSHTHNPVTVLSADYLLGFSRPSTREKERGGATPGAAAAPSACLASTCLASACLASTPLSAEREGRI